jgi:hypothetical protein
MRDNLRALVQYVKNYSFQSTYDEVIASAEIQFIAF